MEALIERNRREAAKFLEGNMSLLSEIANKADTAARNRKLRKYGYEAVDVYGEVCKDLLERMVHGSSFQDICADLLKDRVPAITDMSDPMVTSLVIGKLCANAAQRIIYRSTTEVPVGDATAVAGEEVQKEQEELTSQDGQTGSDGNDRQMKAVLSRKAVNRGVHRADVYGVADWSRAAMRDSFTRYMVETDQSVLDTFFSSKWQPSTEVLRNAWNQAFGDMTVAEVIFGMDPTTGTFRENEDDSGASVYPTFYPYKPLVLTGSRTACADRTSADHLAKCRYCRMFVPTSERVQDARRRHDADERAKKAQDDKYVPKPYNPPKMAKQCPPGKVDRWRRVDTMSMLPESATNATNTALRRALVEFAREARNVVNQYWKAQAAQMVLDREIRDYMEDRDEVGQGTPKVYTDQMLPNATWQPIFPNDTDGAKDGRRWSIVPSWGEGFQLGETDIYDAYANEDDPYMPGVKRTIETIQDMLVGPIKVSNHGDMCIDGETGTFVYGLGGMIKWNRTVASARRLISVMMTHSIAFRQFTE